MAPRRTNKTDPRNKATPISQLRGGAKEARIRRVTKAEAGPQGYNGPSVGQTARTPQRPQQGQRTGRALPPRGGTSAGSSGAEVRTGRPVGGQLATRPSVDRKQPRLPADSRRGGVRIGNSSQPWGEQPTRPVQVRDVTGQPQVSGRNQQSLPQGRPTRMETAQAKAAQAKAGTTGPNRVGQPAGAANRMYGANRVNQAVGSAVRQGRLNLVGKTAGSGLAGLTLGLGVAKQLNPKDNALIDLRNLGRSVYNATTPKGGTKKRYEGEGAWATKANQKVDAENRVTWQRQNAASRPKPQPAAKPQTAKPQPPAASRPPTSAPSRSSSSRPQSSGGSTTPTPRQTAAPAASSPPTAPSKSNPPKPFNPNRGTSRTDNPLIRKDEWLMGKINQREQANADLAIQQGKASKAEYNVSEEEGKKRLKRKVGG